MMLKPKTIIHAYQNHHGSPGEIWGFFVPGAIPPEKKPSRRYLVSIATKHNIYRELL
jgi:hypothetical protein